MASVNKQILIRLTPEDDAALERIKATLGGASNSVAVRWMIRQTDQRPDAAATPKPARRKAGT